MVGFIMEDLDGNSFESFANVTVEWFMSEATP